MDRRISEGKIMKKFTASILTSVFIISAQSFSANAATVVTDPGNYGYLTGIDSKLQEELGFLQKLQDLDISINSNVSGNKQIGYGVNNNLLLYDDFLSLTLSPYKSDKPATISKNLDVVFPAAKVKQNNDLDKKKYQQSALRASIIFSEMVISSAKQKISQITSLASDIDGTSKLKEGVDVNSRVLLEILVEIRNTNLLLASLTKALASKEYLGNLTAETEEKDKTKDFLKGEGELGASISNSPGRNGKFTKLTR